MKLLFVLALALSLIGNSNPVLAADTANPKPQEVLSLMKRAADWQLAHPSLHGTRDWTQGAFYAGVMALYSVSHEQVYLDAMLQMGMKNQWKPGPRPYHADDQAVSQTYGELYLLQKDPQMIAPTRERVDSILQDPRQGSLKMSGKSQERWSWADALFMAPPAWIRLYHATGDKRYLDFMDHEWWATTDYLYAPSEGFFYRDSTFFSKTAPNGKKIFWGRGNGWVYGGLVRVLEYLPLDYPSRPKYLRLYREMTEAIVKAQQEDGLWRPSLLDPNQVPKGETSGSGFFCYGLAWGVNHALLDQKKYWPAAARGWAALGGKVHPDGMLGAVQRIGSAPDQISDDSTEVYGVGAFLLAGSEIYRHVAKKPILALALVPLLSVGTLELARAAGTPPPAQPATWCRFVPERMDDFAWENDLTAFRAYGPVIKASKGTENSGIDCWCKRVRYPIIDKWYAGDKKGISYHSDHGEGNDLYHVGSSRGCGGTAIWKNGKMVLGGLYKEWKIIFRTPQKSVFTLSYDYDVDGQTIHEVKQITIELGKRLFRSESTFTQNGKPVLLDIAVGVTTHDGKAKAALDPKRGWLSCWETIEGNGLGTGVVIAPARVVEMREVKSTKPDESHALLLTKSDKAGKVTFYAGYGWQKAREITTPEQWQNYLTQFAATLQ